MDGPSYSDSVGVGCFVFVVMEVIVIIACIALVRMLF